MSTVTTTPDRRAMRSMAGPSHDASAGEPDAVLGWIPIARRLADAGTLLMASRYQPDRVELVVRPSAATLRDIGATTSPRP